MDLVLLGNLNDPTDLIDIIYLRCPMIIVDQIDFNDITDLISLLT